MKNARFKLTGDVESKLNQIERFMGHLSRKTVRVAEVVVPPLPLGGFVKTPDEDGIVFRTLIATSGILSKVMVQLGKVAKDSNPQIELEVNRLAELSVYKMVSGSYPGEIPVSKGDQITIRVRSVQKLNRPAEETEPAVQDIWIGLVFLGEKSEGKVEQVLLDKVLEEAEKDEGI